MLNGCSITRQDFCLEMNMLKFKTATNCLKLKISVLKMSVSELN